MNREQDGSLNLRFRLSKEQADQFEEFLRKTGKTPEGLVGTGVYAVGRLSEHIGEGGRVFAVGDYEEGDIGIGSNRRKRLITEDYIEVRFGEYYYLDELRDEMGLSTKKTPSLLQRIRDYFRK